MFTLNFETRGSGIKRFVSNFRNKSGVYFSVEISGSRIDEAFETFIDNPQKTYAVEVCRCDSPESWSYHTLCKREYFLGKDIAEFVSNILVRFNAVQDGTPVDVNFNINNKHYSYIVMNAGLPCLAA